MYFNTDISDAVISTISSLNNSNQISVISVGTLIEDIFRILVYICNANNGIIEGQTNRIW
jgi:hypothetical protein